MSLKDSLPPLYVPITEQAAVARGPGLSRTFLEAPFEQTCLSESRSVYLIVIKTKVQTLLPKVKPSETFLHMVSGPKKDDSVLEVVGCASSGRSCALL